MTRLIKTFGGAAVTALVIAATAPMAMADSNDDAAESQAFLSSGMTLTQAATAAETDSGGTAMSAAWEHTESGGMVFEVELAYPDGKVTTVQVDPASGAVTALADQNDDGEDDDD